MKDLSEINVDNKHSSVNKLNIVTVKNDWISSFLNFDTGISWDFDTLKHRLAFDPKDRTDHDHSLSTKIKGHFCGPFIKLFPELSVNETCTKFVINK